MRCNILVLSCHGRQANGLHQVAPARVGAYSLQLLLRINHSPRSQSIGRIAVDAVNTYSAHSSFKHQLLLESPARAVCTFATIIPAAFLCCTIPISKPKRQAASPAGAW